jgi:hypothetical protein
MLDFTNCSIGDVIAHQIGNKTNNEDIVLSDSLLETHDSRLRELLIKYFLYPFKGAEEFYSFTFSNDDFNLNPLYQFTTDIFSKNSNIGFASKNIAKHLYEVSLNPQIKSGDLFVATFSNVEIDDETVNVLGIFKSENRQPFLKLNKNLKEFALNYEDGINVDKLDKGCLILNIDKENGYKICVIDKSNKSGEAQYWKDFFLNIKQVSNDFHQTNQFLGITKQFVTKQLDEDFEVSKADKIDLLNRSVDYFKTHESFDKKEFEKEVFQDAGIIKSFRNFDDNYRQENEIELTDNFDISPQAVKKQARVFKSVLKLDKNFHIYIHGNRELIEQGVEKDGRKFYKIYFKEES